MTSKSTPTLKRPSPRSSVASQLEALAKRALAAESKQLKPPPARRRVNPSPPGPARRDARRDPTKVTANRASVKADARSLASSRRSVSAPGRKILVEAHGPEPWKPHKYQKKAVKFLLEHAAAGLFLDPGLGKTAIVLAAFKILKKLGVATRMLVVAPLRPATLVWPPEIAKWSDFCHLKCVVLHGLKKDQLLEEAKTADVVVVNPDGLDWLFDVKKEKYETRTGKNKVNISMDLSTRFKALEIDTLVIDEASKFKHSTSQRFRILKEVLDHFDRRWGLTGSPSAGGLMDLFGIMYVIDGGRALGPFITHYRNAYFMQSGWGGYDYVPQPGGEKRIYERIAPTVLRMDADDYLELPEVVSSVIPILLPPDVQRHYDDLEAEFITELETQGKKILVTASNTGASLVKCRQIANGGLYMDRDVDETGRKVGKREWADLHDEKVQAALDYKDEILGNQLLVTFDFEHDLQRLLKGFGKDTPFIRGGMSMKKTKEIENAWNAGEIGTLLVNAETVALGLNLQGSNAHHIFMHSLTYNYEVYDQLIRRLKRQGNKAKRVFVKHAVARDTVDEAMMETIKKKAAGQNAFFDFLKAYAKKRKASRSRQLEEA